jgi:hypothetical protein
MAIKDLSFKKKALANKCYTIILAILMVLMLVGSCVAMPYAVSDELNATNSDIASSTEDTKNPKLAFSSYYQPMNISVNLTVSPYQLPLNFSNITNIGNITANFELNERERELLGNNGFVIIVYGQEDDIVVPYKDMKERGIPIFVTSDTLLHLYHIQFDKILKGVEEREFFDLLVDLSNAMLEQSVQDYESFADPELKEAAIRNVAYFAVALNLLQTPTEGYNDSKDSKEVNFSIPDYVVEVVDNEINNIEKT